MVEMHKKIIILYVLSLAITGVGCAGGGSLKVSSIAGGGGSAVLTQERMMMIAKTYENQGHDERAITAYRQVLKGDSRSQFAQSARGRLLALKDNAGQPEEVSAETMLAVVETEEVDTTPEVEQEKAPQTQALEDETEIVAIDVPMPLITSRVVSSELSSENAVAGPAEECVKAHTVVEDALWPEWTVAGIKANEGGSEEQGLVAEMAVNIEEEVTMESDVAGTGPGVGVESKGWSVSKEAKESEGQGVNWVATRQQQDDGAQQSLVNEKLAALAYLVGNEERVNDEALDSLVVLLGHEDQYVRINSAEALAKHGRNGKKVMETIAEVLEDGDESVRVIAVHALVSAYERSPEETYQLMVGQLNTDSVAVLRQVALMLGDFTGHAVELRPALEELVSEHPDEQVRKAALLSLVCLED